MNCSISNFNFINNFIFNFIILMILILHFNFIFIIKVFIFDFSLKNVIKLNSFRFFSDFIFYFAFCETESFSYHHVTLSTNYTVALCNIIFILILINKFSYFVKFNNLLTFWTSWFLFCFFFEINPSSYTVFMENVFITAT